jgi:hypothetical protein
MNYLYRKGYESDLIQAELENYTDKSLWNSRDFCTSF